MRIGLWVTAVVLLVLGTYLLFEHSETKYIVFTLLGCLFFAYAAELQQGTRPERFAASAVKTNALATAPAPPFGSLVVFRFGVPSKFIGMDLHIDGRSIAQLKSPRFTRVEVQAGEYELTAAFCSYVTNKRSPKAVQISISEGQTAIVGIAVGLPERWKWWRLGSRENWRDQIYLTVAPEEAREETLAYLDKMKMIVPDQERVER
jgi:hypothetical protein